MSQYLEVPNFSKFQNYKKRDPIWIKLYRSMLDDYEFNRMPESDQINIIKLWLYAAKTGNKIPNDPHFIQGVIHSMEPPDLDRLIEGGWLVAIKSVSRSKKPAITEESRVEKSRVEKETTLEPPPKKTAAVPEDAIFGFPTIGKEKVWWFREEYLNEMFKDYGVGLDPLAESKRALSWLKEDLTRRKTAKGMKRFLGGWFRRAIANGTGAPPKKAPQLRAEAQRMQKALKDDIEQRKRHAQRGNGKGTTGDIQPIGDILKGDPNTPTPPVYRDPETVGVEDTAPATTPQTGN